VLSNCSVFVEEQDVNGPSPFVESAVVITARSTGSVRDAVAINVTDATEAILSKHALKLEDDEQHAPTTLIPLRNRRFAPILAQEHRQAR
jgi:hypothetical protein